MTTLAKAQFKSAMVMVRHAVDEADVDMAQFVYGELFRELQKLANRFPIGNGYKIPVSLSREPVLESTAEQSCS